jgi:PAS domain S-box-containing protein
VIGVDIFILFVYIAIRINQDFFDVQKALSDYERLKYFNLTGAAMDADLPKDKLLGTFTENTLHASDSLAIAFIEVTENSYIMSHYRAEHQKDTSLFYHITGEADINSWNKYHDMSSAPLLIRTVMQTSRPQIVDSIAAVPVQASGTIHGILLFKNRQNVNDISLYELFANQCAQILKRIELLQSYKKARDEQAALLDNIDTLIWYFSDSETLGRVNNAFAEFFNYPISRIQGRPAESVAKHSNALAKLVKKCVPVFSSGTMLSFEDTYTDAKGLEKTLLIRVTPKISHDQKVEYAVCVGYDISELRQMEKQLHHTQKMEAIGQLAGGMAHNFNNLLSSIVGYADLIVAETTEPPVKLYANKISMAGQHGSHLTQQLLAFARKGKYENSPINLSDTTRDVVSIIESTFDKKISISAVYKIEEAIVLGDSSQLFQMLLNLALNSRDAMPNGGKITFIVDQAVIDSDFCTRNTWAKEGTYNHIEVSDTGCGIAPEVIGHIFEPFFTTKETGKGVGLGLSSVYGCIKNHKGYISVESVEGKGTSFHIYIPPIEKKEKPLRKQPLLTETSIIKNRRTLLIVEDEDDVRLVTALSLEKAGYSVKAFSSGKTAIAFYKDHWKEVDLVLLDITMPEMNGLECMRRLKWINPKIKVMVASGHTLEGDAQILLDEGAVKYIQKPWKRKELIKTIEEIISA